MPRGYPAKRFRAKRGQFTHGTANGYWSHGCRCDACIRRVLPRDCERCGQPSSGRMCKACRTAGAATRDARACQRCGAPLAGQQVKFCSIKCANRTHNERRRGTGRGDRKPSKTRRDERQRTAAGLTGYERGKLLAAWRRQGRPCAYCGDAADTVDHVIPLVRGGDNFEGNLVPACRRCNASKCDFLLVEWRRRQVPGSTVQPLWRGERYWRPRRPGPRAVRGVQQVLAVCVICGVMFQGGDNRRTCGDRHCAREWTGRLARDQYRREHGIPVDENEPTLYWIRLHGLPDTRRRASRRSA